MTRAPVPLAHSAIGASSMSRLIACPGSFRLSRQLKGSAASNTTIYAATGTVAHALAEDVMNTHIDPSTLVGDVRTVDGHDVEITMEMVEAVTIYIDLVNSWHQTADEVWLETRVVLDEYWSPKTRPPVSAFGTADAVAYHEARQHVDIGDYKNGAGVWVDVMDNPQVLYYAAGVLKLLESKNMPVRTVTTHIIQPNVRGTEKVRSQELAAADVLMWVHDVLKPTIAKLFEPDAELRAGKHCRFCPAAVGCPARDKLRQDAAARNFGPNYDDLKTYSPYALQNVLDELEILDMHATALREHALARIQAGERIPGWRVVPTRPVRSWDKGVDAKTLTTETGLSANVLTEPLKLKTPAQMEKALGPDLWLQISGHVVSKSSGVKLTPDDPTPIDA
jgi:hypothetical protein